MGANCQSCGMPMKKDAQGGGIESDGTRSSTYCSHCYADGKFVRPDITMEEMNRLVAEKIQAAGFPSLLAKMLASRTKHLKRWARAAK